MEEDADYSNMDSALGALLAKYSVRNYAPPLQPIHRPLHHFVRCVLPKEEKRGASPKRRLAQSSDAGCKGRKNRNTL